MGEAKRVAEAYGDNKRLAAVAVAGSVGAGWADRWSDLELDCYWLQPPSDADRRDPIDRAAAAIEAFWDYDADDQEWSEDYRLGPLAVTVSNFTVTTVEHLLDAVIERTDTDPVKHMRLAAIQRCQVLRGGNRIGRWQTRAAQYPNRLVAAMVEQALTPSVLVGWSAREALLERGDTVAVQELLARIGRAVLATVLAVNRVYQPHRGLKWQRRLIADCALTPDRLAERLESLSRESCSRPLADAETLLTETLDLAERHTQTELTTFHDALHEHRLPTAAPPVVHANDLSQ